MSAKTSISRLHESGRPVESVKQHESILPAVEVVLRRVRQHGRLRTKAAWRLHPDEVRHLENLTGLSPSGGWSALIALLAGTDYLVAERSEFVAGEPLEATAGEDDMRLALVEAFTLRLIPPQTAASVFMALGIHPAWGLRLAWEVQHRGDEEEPPPALGVLPMVGLERVREVVSTFVFTIVETLRALESGRSYSITALTGVVEDAVLFARRAVLEEPTGDHGHIPMFLEMDTSRTRLPTILTRDLFDDVLVPSGSACDLGGQRFCVFEGVLDRVRVFDGSHEEPTTLYERFRHYGGV
jgi:hypothetical protein